MAVRSDSIRSSSAASRARPARATWSCAARSARLRFALPHGIGNREARGDLVGAVVQGGVDLPQPILHPDRDVGAAVDPRQLRRRLRGADRFLEALQLGSLLAGEGEPLGDASANLLRIQRDGVAKALSASRESARESAALSTLSVRTKFPRSSRSRSRSTPSRRTWFCPALRPSRSGPGPPPGAPPSARRARASPPRASARA